VTGILDQFQGSSSSNVAMTVGVAASLLLMRIWLGLELRVECRGDVCITDTRSSEIRVAATRERS
jgi:hypothetical protein